MIYVIAPRSFHQNSYAECEEIEDTGRDISYGKEN